MEGYERGDVEYDEEYPVDPERRVDDDVEGLPRHGEEPGLHAKDEPRGKAEDEGPDDEDDAVYDGRPHEEGCEGRDVHALIIAGFGGGGGVMLVCLLDGGVSSLLTSDVNTSPLNE